MLQILQILPVLRPTTLLNSAAQTDIFFKVFGEFEAGAVPRQGLDWSAKQHPHMTCCEMMLSKHPFPSSIAGQQHQNLDNQRAENQQKNDTWEQK